MTELFILCALSLPSGQFHIPIVQYHAIKSERERLTDWIRRNNPDAEVFIHPTPQRGKLKEYGYEKVPFTWRNNEIWIRRKEISDRPKRSA